MQIARVRLFSLFGAMLFLLNLLTSNVIYHNICILSTLILKNLMYLKSIDELPTPFPLSAFITFHSLSLPSVAFHCLLSPFIVFHYLSSPPHLIVRPLSAPPFYPHLAPFCPRLAPFCSRLAAFCPRLCPVLFSPRPVLSSPRPVLSSPRPVSSSPRPVLFSPCPVLSSPRPTLSPFPRFTHLLPSCFITPFVLLPPPSLYSLPLFCTRFFTPRQPPQTRPRHRKRQRFSHFSKKFCKKPLTKQKKVLY